MDLSLAGLLGAIVGTLSRAINYGMADRLRRTSAARRTTDRRPPRSARRSSASSLMRRIVLALDIRVFGGVGYWLGDLIGG